MRQVHHRSLHTARRLLTAMTLLLLSHSIASAQRYNLIPNGSFEEPQLTSCVLSNMSALYDWGTLAPSPDVQWDGCDHWGWTYPSGAGRQYVFLGNWREGIKVRLKEPLRIGQTYDFSFLGMTRNPLFGSKGKIHIYLSENPMDVNNYDQGTMIWGDEKDGKLRKKAKKWHRYETSFVADRAYEYLAMRVEESRGDNGIALDDMTLTFSDHNCTGNLIPNASFEVNVNGFAKDWDNIQGDYGVIYQVGSANSPNVMGSAHTGNNWYTLNSFQGFVRADAAIGIELTKPLVPGRTYRLSFHAATKNNLTHHKGEIRFVADTQPIVWDWNDGDRLTGTNIMDDTRIEGNEEEWHYFEHDFTPWQAYTHIAVQSRSGYHVDIDDICITSDPTTRGVVQFAKPDYDVTESMGPGTILLERIDGYAGSVSVDLQTVGGGGSATPNGDYTTVSTTVTFANGQTTATVQVPILDDVLKEGDETVALTLSNPTNGATIGLASATLNIIDDLNGKLSTGGLTLEESILRRGKIVWASDKAPGGTVGTTDQLYYNEVRSTSPPKLIPGTSQGRDPVWSHNGTYIAYVTREPYSGSGGSLLADRLKIIDQEGNVYADYFAPTLTGFSFFGAPAWSDDGTKIVVPYYSNWPTTGLITIDFSSAYTFASPGTTILVNESFGASAMDPVFSPGGASVYFHGTSSSSNYLLNTFLFRYDMATPWLPPAILYGNGSVIDRAFAPSIDRSGGKLIFNSEAWRQDLFDIYEDEEILALDLTSGALTRATAESENDYGSFAKGALAKDQFVRQNNADANRNQLSLQRGGLVLPFSTADSSNLFNDHAPDWVIPKINIWDLTATYDQALPGALLGWRDVVVESDEPRVFTVERSVDRINWMPVGTVQRTGLELVETSYTFSDATVFNLGVPLVFYRIGVVDETDPCGFSWSMPVHVIIPPENPEGETTLE